jgi:transposase-like protein
MRFAAGLPGSDIDSSDSNNDRPKKTQISYSREKKLQAITYFEKTDVPGTKGRANTPIPLRWAARTLGIDRKQLRDWKKNKTKILYMKKGAKRYRRVTSEHEPELEFQLHAVFIEAQAKRRIIASR